MTTSDLNLPPGRVSEVESYRDAFSSIIRYFMRLFSPVEALAVARRIPGLIIDDAGNVLDYDKSYPAHSLALLITEYQIIFESDAGRPKPATSAEGSSIPDESLRYTAGVTPHTRIAPLRLLVVDDHVLFRQGLTRLLDPQPDFKVISEAATVQETIALTRVLHPDAVLMDISLPDGTGLDATQAIIAERPGTKIVFLTAHDDDESLFAAIRAGGIGYLPKSVGAAELINQLRGISRGEAVISPAIARRILAEFSRLPSPEDPNTSTAIQLTTREIEIIRAVAGGATNHEIAERLLISEHTVKNHLKRVLAKLHLHSRSASKE